MNRRMVVLVVALLVALPDVLAPVALAQAPRGGPASGRQPAPASQQEPVRLRLSACRIAGATVFEALKVFRAARPDIEVAFQHVSDWKTCKQFADGEADVAVVEGRQDVLTHKFQVETGKPLVALGQVFKAGQIRSFVIGRRALAIVVHPKCPVQRVDEAMLRAILLSVGGTNRPNPLAAHGIQYAGDGMASSEMFLAVMGGDGPVNRSGMRAAKGTYDYDRTQNLLKEVAADPTLMGFTQVSEAVRLSGLRVLAISRGNGPPVAPTAANVLSGAYPYQTYLLAAVHPKAPPEALDLAKWFQSEEAAKILASKRWITTASADEPAPAEAGIWPAPDTAAAREPIRGGVAVLPTQLLTKAFLLGELSHLAGYEDDVAAAIEADQHLTLLDRANLARVLSEARLDTTPDARPPAIAADVLVLLQVVTERSATSLRVQAFHSATSTLLGEMKLPVDPAHPESFDPPLAQRTTQWWPGVLRNLRWANERPVWAIRAVGRAGAPARPASALVKGRGDELAAIDTVFYARYSGLAEGQQETLMSLMGLARPETARGTPAADYIVEVQLVPDGRLVLGVHRGTDFQPLASAAFDLKAVSEARSWVRAQTLSALGQQRAARTQGAAEDSEAARRQAQEELARARQCRARCDELERTPAGRRTEAQELELASQRTEMCLAYERAVQLDPSLEEAAQGTVAGKVRRYRAAARGPDAAEALVAAIRSEEMFLSSFPKAAGRPEMLAEFAGLCVTAADQLGAGLQPADARMVREQFLAKAVTAYEECLSGPLRPIVRIGVDPRWASFAHTLSKYMANLAESPAKAEAFLRDWASRNDARPTRMIHADIVRLFLLEQRKDKNGYLALFRELQKRWSDTGHFQWKQFGFMISDGLQQLFGHDSKQIFYEWIDGKRGPGDLPYPGYRPEGESPPK